MTKTFDAYWAARAEAYQRFLAKAKKRPNKICIPIPRENRDKILIQLDRVTVRLADRLGDHNDL